MLIIYDLNRAYTLMDALFKPMDGLRKCCPFVYITSKQPPIGTLSFPNKFLKCALSNMAKKRYRLLGVLKRFILHVDSYGG